MADMEMMTREQMINEAVRSSMSRRTMLAMIHRADSDEIRCSSKPFAYVPRRLKDIRAEFCRIADEHAHEKAAVKRARRNATNKERRRIARARAKRTPGPMRGGKPDLSRWDFARHAHPSLWGNGAPEPEPYRAAAIRYASPLAFLDEIVGLPWYCVNRIAEITKPVPCSSYELSLLSRRALMRNPIVALEGVPVIEAHLAKYGLSLAHA